MGNKLRHSIATALAALALTTSPPSRADEGDTYRHYDYPREPLRLEIVPPYLIDPVNRRSSLTPEPVWREMFPDVHRRIEAEERIFGVPGQTDRELRYWRNLEVPPR